MTTEKLMEGNLLIAQFMEWESHQKYHESLGNYTEYYIYDDRGIHISSYIHLVAYDRNFIEALWLIQEVAEKISAEVEYIALKVRKTFKGKIQWTAAINTSPYLNLGYGRGTTPSEALYKVIVNYLKKRNNV